MATFQYLSYKRVCIAHPFDLSNSEFRQDQRDILKPQKNLDSSIRSHKCSSENVVVCISCGAVMFPWEMSEADDDHNSFSACWNKGRIQLKLFRGLLPTLSLTVWQKLSDIQAVLGNINDWCLACTNVSGKIMEFRGKWLKPHCVVLKSSFLFLFYSITLLYVYILILMCMSHSYLTWLTIAAYNKRVLDVCLGF